MLEQDLKIAGWVVLLAFTGFLFYHVIKAAFKYVEQGGVL